MDIIEAFKARVKTAIAAHGMAPTTFGAAALGDPNFVADLIDNGREPKMRTIQKVDDFIAGLDKPKARKAG